MSCEHEAPDGPPTGVEKRVRSMRTQLLCYGPARRRGALLEGSAGSRGDTNDHRQYSGNHIDFLLTQWVRSVIPDHEPQRDPVKHYDDE